MSYTDTAISTEIVPECGPSEVDTIHPGLTPRRIIKILVYAYNLTRENRQLMIKGFSMSLLWACIGVMSGYPMKYMVDWTSQTDLAKKVPFTEFIWTSIVLLAVISTLHNIVFPYHLNKRRTRLLIAVKKSLSVNAVVNINSIDKSTLKKLQDVAGTNLQAWLNVSREEIANLIITAVFDAPMYLRGACMIVYFLWVSIEAPWFAVVSISGIAVYGAITFIIGIRISKLFRDKQVAFMALQGEEQRIFNDLLQSRNFSMFDLLFKRRTSVDADQFAEVWDDFEQKFLDPEIRLLRYNMLVRDSVLEVTKCVCLIVGLCQADPNRAFTYGTAFFLVDQIGKAADPFALFGPLQKMLLNSEIFIEGHMAISRQNDQASA